MANVLIVDDSPSEAALMQSVVQQAGHQAKTVGDGEACLEAVKAQKPALILLDVVLPKLDGFGTCRKLKKDPDTAGIPIIIVTSKKQESDKFWAKRQGADLFLSKPFAPDALKDAIKQFLPS